MHLKQRGMHNEAQDYDDIIDYTDRVTYNVLRAVQEGVFQNIDNKKFNLPNLMAIEDSFLFGEELNP